MNACRTLREYSWFVSQVYKNLERYDNLERPAGLAPEEMPREYEIRTFLTADRAEVKRMCITEYNEAKTFAAFRL